MKPTGKRLIFCDIGVEDSLERINDKLEVHCNEYEYRYKKYYVSTNDSQSLPKRIFIVMKNHHTQVPVGLYLGGLVFVARSLWKRRGSLGEGWEFNCYMITKIINRSALRIYAMPWDLIAHEKQISPKLLRKKSRLITLHEIRQVIMPTRSSYLEPWIRKIVACGQMSNGTNLVLVKRAIGGKEKNIYFKYGYESCISSFGHLGGERSMNHELGKFNNDESAWEKFKKYLE